MVFRTEVELANGKTEILQVSVQGILTGEVSLYR
jgi:hypothetical protein